MAHSSGPGRDRTPPLPGRRRSRVALAAAVSLAAVTGLALAKAAADPTIPAQSRTGAPHGKTPPNGPPHLAPSASSADADAGFPFATPEDPEQAEREFEDIKAKAARIARAKNQRNALRDKVTGMLKGAPMDIALKQELTTHARRIARLERAKKLAADRKDQAGGERAAKLIEIENARHEKWLSGFDAAKGAPK